MRKFSFLYSFLQPTESRGIAQTTEVLHLLRGDVLVFFEIIRQQTVNLDFADIYRALRMLGSKVNLMLSARIS